MKKNLLVMTMLMIFTALAFNSYAEDNQANEDTIKAECKDEAQGAENPEVYYDECVAERMQALHDEQGGAGSGDTETSQPDQS